MRTHAKHKVHDGCKDKKKNCLCSREMITFTMEVPGTLRSKLPGKLSFKLKSRMIIHQIMQDCFKNASTRIQLGRRGNHGYITM
jgi:hypothetical protein